MLRWEKCLIGSQNISSFWSMFYKEFKQENILYTIQNCLTCHIYMLHCLTLFFPSFSSLHGIHSYLLLLVGHPDVSCWTLTTAFDFPWAIRQSCVFQSEKNVINPGAVQDVVLSYIHIHRLHLWDRLRYTHVFNLSTGWFGCS